MATKPIYKTITNEAVAGFTTEHPADLKGFTVGIAETLDGVSEVNLVRTGINLWDEKWEVGTLNNQGQNATDNSRIRAKNYIPVKPNLSIYFSHVNGIASLYYYDVNKAFISSGSFDNSKSYTIPNNCYYLRFVMASAYGTTYNNDISINYPSTNTSYNAYEGTTRTIDLDTTVYGGIVIVDSEGNCIYSDGENTTELDPIDPIKTLAGVNNIYADTGDILSLTYVDHYDYVIEEPVMDISSPLGALWEQAAGIDGTYPIGDYALLVTKGGDCLATKNGELLEIKGGS